MLIKNVTIFDGITLQENKNVFIEQNKIISITNNLSHTHQNNLKPHKLEIDGRGHILAPGFIDIQVNGGGGVFFNDAPTVQSIKKISEAHLQYGTTSILPTFISDEFSKVKLALEAVKKARIHLGQSILGLHLEGPYLNSQKKGIHKQEHIYTATQKEVNEICQFELPIKLVTLAPELVSAAFIKQFSENKVHVFAGHTNATFAQMQTAIQSGVCGITHLFNACSPLTSRESGVVGAGLWNDKIWCGLIADGLHVSYDTIKIAFKSKKTEHFILVSDAMPPVGTDLSEFSVHGQTIYVKGDKYEDEHGTLAGSSLTLHQALKNIVSHHCASLPAALAMTSTNAATCLQLDKIKGKVCVGYDADLVLLNKNNLDLMTVIQNGEVIK